MKLKTKGTIRQKEELILKLPYKHLIFLDEVGDPFLHKDIKSYDDPTFFPVMTVTAIILSKNKYKSVLMPELDRMKKKYFGTEAISFHSREIRRKAGLYKIFLDDKIYASFKNEIDGLLEKSEIKIISSSINKISFAKKALEFEKQSGQQYNVGDIYLKNVGYVIERIGHLLKGESGRIVFEERGRKESRKIQALLTDAKLNGTFYCSKKRFSSINDKIMFFNKRDNINGLQIADYCTYPFARHSKNPKDINNKFFNLLRKYIYKGDHSEYGLKEWP
jgi:hypothetical protein